MTTNSTPSSASPELGYEQPSPSQYGQQKGYEYIWTRIIQLMRLKRRLLYISLTLFIILALAFLVWLSLVITLIHRLAPTASSNGLQSIVDKWQSPPDSTAFLSPWPVDFSRDITPIPCHSHNDYTRKVPLYSALAVGCTSVEAGIWLRNDIGAGELLLGHSARSLKADRTLQSLYLEPLLRILENQNTNIDGSQQPTGVFETSPNTTLVLLLDFKSNSRELWPVVQKHLEPLRQRNWLTQWNGTTNEVTIRPITVVATGGAKFEDVISSDRYRDIFLDAPLEDIADPKYSTSNSYYASISISKAVGKMWFGKLSSKQLEMIRTQISEAKAKGLRARYWDTVAWPIGWRDYVWSILVENGTGILNVDRLEEASRWNWGVCIVAGLVLCGY